MEVYFRLSNYKTYILAGLIFYLSTPTINVNAQSISENLVAKTVGDNPNDHDIFGTTKNIIENIGQYGNEYPQLATMGKILYAYEGLDMPVLFTSGGLILLHRKMTGLSEAEREKSNNTTKHKKAEPNAEELKQAVRAISFEWVGAKKNAEIIAEGKTSSYYTYGLLPERAYGYKKITYKDIYPGIDLIFSFNNSSNAGVEYSMKLKPNANIQLVKMKFGGDIVRIKKDNNGNLILKSTAGTTIHTVPVSYYGSETIASEKISEKITTTFEISHRTVSFALSPTCNRSRDIIIDPFITNTANLTGTGSNSGMAKDVDFDYAGNVYVTGGGNGQSYKLAKFDAAGTLLWTFSGVLNIPAWTFGSYYGGWVVEKNSGNIYLGQGFAPGGGHRIIRINTTGVYDNYITTANANFLENWKMYWSCNNGNPQILIAGGGTNSNNNFAICSPPSTLITPLNVTGIPYSSGTGWAQDIADVIIDPSTNALYTIYGSLYGTPSLANKIYKNNAPYSSASVAWTVPSGYTTIQEIANRPYLAGPEIDNSCNVFAVNSGLLFFWDGKNLKAIDKTSGANVGTPLTTAGVPLMTGGIVADECNNVFVGSSNGTIKVYSFTGTTFDDAAKADIIIPGFGSGSVYDLAYNESQKLLYASGAGFVASFDVAPYSCASNIFTINVSSNCGTLSATTTLSPLPPPGSIVTYVLYNAGQQITSNTTGVFTGLSPNINYTINATINLACSGVLTSTTFTLPGPVITPVVVNTNCGSNNGSITLSATGGITPYTYSKDGIVFQSSNSFTGLAAGLYTITVKDVNGCSNTVVVNVSNTNGPAVTFTKTDAVCGSNTGTLTATATGGVAPLTYSINGINFQTNNFFTGIAPGSYTLTVKDATGCINVMPVKINSGSLATLTAIPSTTYCNTSNGSIIAIVQGGVAPYLFSINGNTYQSANVFTLLAGGTYTVTVKDANGCLSTTSATVANSSGPTLSLISAAATCSNANGSITATGSGGVVPLVYSINGGLFQASNFFGGLTPGTYTITVKDANSCTNFLTATVSSTNGPQVTGIATTSACNSNTGTITATGSGGTGALQYSINGINFQASTLFTGLAANTYTLLVKDANGCMGGFIVVVPNTAAPLVSLSTTPTSCNVSNGIITTSGSGGTPPYQYSKDTGATYQASNIFSPLATGPYMVIIKDINGCTSTAASTMTNIAGLSLTASAISSSCITSNGSITAVGLGGTAPLQYSINGTVYQSSNIFNALSGGVYTVYVKDVSGCVSTTTATVSTTQAPVITATATNATCAGSNAIITANGSGGVAPLLYSINGSTYQSGNIFLNIGPGTYTVYVKDAANCVQTTTVSITNTGTGPGITSFTVVSNDAYLCNANLGKITNPKVNGATCGTCTYSLNFGAYIPNATQLFLNLNPGLYYVTAMDANGCTKTIPVTINVGAPSTATATIIGTGCNTSNGSITIHGIGPNTPYHASISGIGGPWVNFNNNYTFTGLAPGTYTIIMADDESYDPGPPLDPGGCLSYLTVIVPSIGGPSATLSIYDGTCSLNDGSITITATGGTAPYLYDLSGSGYQTSNIFNGLGTGTYIISVLDDSGCVTTLIDSIQNPTGPTITTNVQPATCGSSTGVINALATGGVPPYQYSINGTVFQSSGVFTSLAPGSYNITVADANACITKVSVTVSNQAKPTLSAFAIAATCNTNNGTIIATGSSGTPPYTYSKDGIIFQSSNIFSGLSAGTYTITVQDASGCTTATSLSVSNLLAPQVTVTSTPATCNNASGTITAIGTGGAAPLQYSLGGFVYQASNLFSNQPAGTYTVYVKDANGCISSKNILVTSPVVPQTLTAVVISATCNNSNGSLTASATGGIAPLQYSINGTTFQASPTFSALAPATYTVTVKDANTCTKTLSVTVVNLAGPSLTSSSTLSSCFANDGTITASAIGGTGALTYSKNGIVFQSSPVFTGLAPGTYTITVKDSKGCISNTSISVGQVAAPVLFATDSSSVCGSNIVATGLNGVLPYQYNINNSAYQQSNVFPCLASGTYTIGIIDANGCTDTVIINLTGPLPVQILSFEGYVKQGYNLLQWTSTDEVDNKYFTLEKSKDAISFYPIKIIAPDANNFGIHTYMARDENPEKCINYYRLRQTDGNNTTYISHTIQLNNKGSGAITYAYNAQSNLLWIYCTVCTDKKYLLKLTDDLGRIVYTSADNENPLVYHTEQLTRSVYVLHVITAGDESVYKILIY